MATYLSRWNLFSTVDPCPEGAVNCGSSGNFGITSSLQVQLLMQRPTTVPFFRSDAAEDRISVPESFTYKQEVRVDLPLFHSLLLSLWYYCCLYYSFYSLMKAGSVQLLYCFKSGPSIYVRTDLDGSSPV